ncbi:MAG: ABC transporter substrate-binding protein [Anaerolineales bacterium]|jgi:peptide/nickel transport system substrate-binding protein
MKHFRNILYSVMVLMLLLSACGAPPTPEVVKETVVVTEVVTEKETEVVTVVETEVVTEVIEVEVTPTPGPMVYSEAPLLADMVAAGELSPLEERLPKIPAHDKTVNEECMTYEVGTYGGKLIMNDPNPGAIFPGGMWQSFAENMLNVPGYDFFIDQLEGNILESWEASEDFTTFTFKMREGLKWSDGMPVTTEDIRFWWEDILNNEELTPSLSDTYKSPAGTPLTLEIIDDYNYTITFDEPYGFWLVLYASRHRNYTHFIQPAHYLKQFHADYTALEELEPLIADAGFAEGEWYRLFQQMQGNPRIEPDEYGSLSPPTLSPWVLVEETPTHALYRRNPFFFKVDAAGQQLPYISDIDVIIFSDPETGQLNMISGAVDFTRAAMDSAPLVRENFAENRMIFQDRAAHASVSDFFINWNFDDPIWRQVVSDPNFRQALVHAMPIDDINEAVKLGTGNTDTFIKYDYDIDRANELLDLVMPEKDSQGYRLGPDGERFVIPIEYGPWIAGEWEDVAPLIIDSFGQAGLFVTSKQLEGGFWIENSQANLIKATIIWSHPGLWPFVEPDWMTGFAGGLAAEVATPLWADWVRTDGEEGEEPPDWYKELWDIRVQLWSNPGLRSELWPRVEEIYEEFKPYYNMYSAVRDATVFKENLGNSQTNDLPVCNSVINQFTMESMFWK